MRIAYKNFTGGEIATTLSARYDLSRFNTSLQCMENFLPGLHGGASRRPGFECIAPLAGATWLLPFSFSAVAAQNFVLLFGERTLRIATTSALISTAHVPVIQTPYALKDVPALSHAQVGDDLYLAHSKYPLHKLSRRGSAPYYSWSLHQVIFNASIAAPSPPAVHWNGEAGNFALRYKVVAIDANGKESLASPIGVTTVGKHPSDWVQGNNVVVSWGAVAGAVEYNIYREEAGYFGFIGASQQLSFIDNNYEADIADTPRENWDPFANGNYPSVVAFHQQRMVLAGTARAPQAFYMSRVGDFENFRKSRPLQDDDPVEYHIASGSIDAIVWATSFGDLLLGTAGSEYKASGDGAPITVKNISITAQSYWGSSSLAPIIIGNSIVHVQRHGSRVRDLFYSLERDGYAGNDLSILAPHLFEGHAIHQWAYQQTPGSHIWVVRDDGVLLALTYMKEHDIWGWSRHITEGQVLSVTTVSGDHEDILMAVVRRTINGEDKYFLERLTSPWDEKDPVAQAFFVDCGIMRHFTAAQKHIDGLTHLEGAHVAVLADGSPVDGCIVRDGCIDLPYEARTVIVGLGYVSRLSPMPVEGDMDNGTTLGRRRVCGPCTIRMHASVAGKYGSHPDRLHEFPFVPAKWGEPCEIFSGDMDFIVNAGLAQDEQIWLVQDKPLPFTVTALMVDVKIMQN